MSMTTYSTELGPEHSEATRLVLHLVVLCTQTKVTDGCIEVASHVRLLIVALNHVKRMKCYDTSISYPQGERHIRQSVIWNSLLRTLLE